MLSALVIDQYSTCYKYDDKVVYTKLLQHMWRNLYYLVLVKILKKCYFYAKKIVLNGTNLCL